jgi:hypothetical protein
MEQLEIIEISGVPLNKSGPAQKSKGTFEDSCGP